MTSTLSRYLIRRVATRAVIFLAAFVGILVAGSASVLGGRGAPIESLLPILPTLALFALPMAVPMAVPAAVLVVLSGMRRDGELRALAAAGLSQGAIVGRLWPVIATGFLLAAVLWHVVMPGAVAGLRNSIQSIAQVTVVNRVHKQEPLIASAGLLVWAGGADGSELRDLFVRHTDGDTQQCIFAEHGRWRRTATGGELQFDQPLLVRMSAGSDDVLMMRCHADDSGGLAPRHEKPFDVSLLTGAQEPDALSTLAVARLLDAGPGTTPEQRKRWNNARLTWQMRFYVPFALLCFCLFAAGLAMIGGTSENLAGVVIVTLLVAVSIYPATGYVKSGASREMANPGWVLWPPGIALAVGGVLLVRRADRAHELMEQLRSRLRGLWTQRRTP